jgi:hypothetical protein
MGTELIGHGHQGIEPGGLESDPEQRTHRGAFSDGYPEDPRIAAGGRYQRRQHVEGRTLPRAVRAD